MASTPPIPPIPASGLSSNPSNTILFTNRQYFVGIFKVACAQFKPHPSQRHLKKEWTLKLKDSFLEQGIDRGASPVKALLMSVSASTKLKDVWEGAVMGNPPMLPGGLILLLFDGQHRVAACELMDDPSEHWWYAEVYEKELELDHPVELLTLMHLGNEERLAMNTNDADRFLAMMRLRHLQETQVISSDVYNAAQQRISSAIPKSGTRQGLGNLLRSKELAKAIEQAIQHPHIAPYFNAATWGKKLTVGRFFQLSASLIKEMTMQCSLIQGGRSELDTNPFQLSAYSCSLTQLTAAVNKNASHPWKELEGGINGALERCSKRPPDFVTELNPNGLDKWTFPDLVLLPSVLTSGPVEKVFRDMYSIAQHYVHMIAGPDYLERYTSNKPHSCEDDHPAGIIAKIILQMWNRRERLLDDLRSSKISEASSTSTETYQALINKSEEWWSLLRLLKMRHFPLGIGLTVPKVFTPSDVCNVTPISLQDSPLMEADSAGLDGYSEANLAKEANRKRQPAEELQADTGQDDSQPSGHEGGSQAVSQTTTEPRPSRGKARALPKPRKRIRRERSITTSEDEFEQAQPSEHSQSELPIRAGLKCHGDAVSMLKHLERTVLDMRPEEARALSDLVRSLMSLQGTGHAARVIGHLAEKVKMSSIYDDDDDDDDENLQVGRETSQEVKNIIPGERNDGSSPEEGSGIDF
ncbi:hypothetical protein FRC11_000934 [Ceratobasidium sp. 423]|nr:hypothetical protein FRC11_000934 [Ceratobasidium sp. 423]